MDSPSGNTKVKGGDSPKALQPYTPAGAEEKEQENRQGTLEPTRDVSNFGVPLRLTVILARARATRAPTITPTGLVAQASAADTNIDDNVKIISDPTAVL